MTYYIRYALIDAAPISLSEINDGLQQLGLDYMVDADLLVYKDEEYGQLNIINADDDAFADDLELMKEFAEQSENSAFLLMALQKTVSMIVVQVFWSGRDESEVTQVIQTLFDWLMQNRAGLLMDEDGSFYHALSESARE